MIQHPIRPVWDENSRILILGSFPSVKSRETCFFYGHKQNRFWRVLATLLDTPVPQTTEEKRAFLLTHHIAVWDVIASCNIQGSADATITDVTPNDLSVIQAPIRCIFVNGKTAAALYDKHIFSHNGIKAVCLPSTSPANAACSPEKLTEAWKEILRYL